MGGGGAPRGAYMPPSSASLGPMIGGGGMYITYQVGMLIFYAIIIYYKLASVLYPVLVKLCIICVCLIVLSAILMK